MRATPTRLAGMSLVLVLFLGLVLLVCLGIGTASISPGQVWGWLWGNPTESSAAVILARLRLPRLIIAALVGASLSMSGTVFQGILKNPLAEPFILGVSGGAAAGAVTSHLIGWADMWTTSGMAFCGAVGTVLLVLAIARKRGRMETATLILTGVMINAFFTSAIMFVISTTTDQKLHAIMFWLYGDLSGSTVEQAFLLAPVVILVGLALFFLSRDLNLLSAGDQAALLLGINVERKKLILFLLVSLLCGVTVSVSGLIGFIGLMVPHLLRMMVIHDHRLLLPASGLFGAGFLMLADTTARTIISPAQLPVGVVTAFLGAPFFLLLMVRRGSQWW